MATGTHGHHMQHELRATLTNAGATAAPEQQLRRIHAGPVATGTHGHHMQHELRGDRAFEYLPIVAM